MFEHVVLRRSNNGESISVGELIEALFYYQRVHIVVTRNTLFDWIQKIGPDSVLSILQRPDITAVYCEELLGTHTASVGALHTYHYVSVALAGHEDEPAFKDPEDRLFFELSRLPMDKTAARRFTKNFLRRVPIRKFSGSHFIEAGVPEAAKRDLLDGSFVRRAVRQLVSLAPGGYDLGSTFKFDVVTTDLGVYVFHDIDFDGINSRRAALIPSIEALTLAHILNQIQEARADLALASHYSGDFITSQANSAVIRARHDELLRRTHLNREDQSQFVDLILPDSPSLAEVVDAGERTLKEALILIDQSSRFKDWLKSANPDEGLVRTYVRDITSEGWIQRIPAKSLRYAMTAALEATYPAVGIVASLADNFLIEKLLAGWRPNHFVNSKFAPFLRTR